MKKKKTKKDTRVLFYNYLTTGSTPPPKPEYNEIIHINNYVKINVQYLIKVDDNQISRHI